MIKKSILIICFVITIVSLVGIAILNLNTPKNLTDAIVRKVRACHKDANFKFCIQSYVHSALAFSSPHDFLDALKSRQGINDEMVSACHTVSHAVGRDLFKKFKDISEAFAYCDSTCLSGCYHGAAESFLRGEEDEKIITHINESELKSRINTACVKETSVNARFQCLHGLGHAIKNLTGLDIQKAIALCRAVGGDRDYNSCISGVMMENIAGEPNSRVVNDDVYYPCTMFDGNEKLACYIMQPSRMIQLGLSHIKIAGVCKTLDEKSRRYCLIGLGRELSDDVDGGRLTASAEFCSSLADATDRHSCSEGIIFTLGAHSGDAHLMLSYCEDLESSALRTQCFDTAISDIQRERQTSIESLRQTCVSLKKRPEECTQVANSRK